MKTILLISITLILSTFAVNGGVQDSNNLTGDDYYVTSCLDGVTGEAKLACVDWPASPARCSSYSYPCDDLVVEG